MEKVKLKDIAKVVIGISAPKKFITLNDKNAVPFIRAGALEDLCNNKNNIDEFLDKDKFKSVPRSTVIFAKSGMSALKNRVYSLKEESVIVGHLAGVICNEDKINHRFLEYYLKCNKPSSLNQNDSYPSIRTEDIENIVIELPKLEQQIKTVNKLDKIQEVINIRKKQIEELDKLIKSQFVEMFENKNYEKLSGKELFLFSSGKFLEASKRLENGVPVYGGNGVAWYTDEPLIDFNTIVIGRVGAYCGNVKIIKEPVWITDNAIFIKQFKKDVYNIDFLHYMMELVDFSRFAQFSGQPKITQKPLEEFNYVVPPIEEQIKFSNIVKQIDKQKFELQKSLEGMKKLQESLMNKYFG